MPDLRFFDVGARIGLDQVAALTFASVGKAEGFVSGCAPLSAAGKGKASYFSDRRYLLNLQKTHAEYVFVCSADVDNVPPHSIPLVTASPQASWSRLAARLYTPKVHDGSQAIHPTARIEDGVSLGVGVVVGQNVEIGRGSRIEAYTVIGPGCTIGRDCLIGAHSTIYCALIGDRVHLSSGVRIGEAGFGVSGDKLGLIDVPQLGRVILQDDVSIGAGTCVDRGAFDDTVIGEATKIDNMVQIAHNVKIGRNVIVAAHSGLSGSVQIGDGAMFGGRAGVIDHIEIGEGAKVAAGAIVFKNVPPGQMWSGFPAKPSRQFLRESAWLAKAASSKDKG
ncbi:UDP-3-O-(3-hydroxymyristoyl)glucosamine N-acyltransferase [Asticcacaulis sp. YBE204]|uniref:UDP-3-O-(3-hydroxymyristoyl)glucosamine N-acyltransferase n=1 Tax=Asticcacaulis sp. YBE204 TaxID=1282363 RepID=UPI0003C3DEE6|nr:UDP-3-O-(3-hydroxymyristoyl)glucosamine N-acyltransferase [Asticcacaulis sp. YBE204]ESQ78143.1 UDP-3-O-(3-hydroxymyristoyl) glucosamine N-acyltransferase [Asticcacaulis sp. YBE204]